MANTIIVKRSSVAGKVPAAGDLQIGELAVNLTDQKIYTKNSSGTVVQLGGGSGSGDVVGPASATDNALVRFDTTTGKLIQNGVITQDDNGNLALVNGVSFNTSPISPPTAAGSMYWDSGDGTPAVVLNANTNLQLGQENVAKVYNGTGSTIAKGAVVAVNGAQGQRPSVALADADAESTSAFTLGIAAEAIANGTEGLICTFGFVRGIDTSAFTTGQPIYLSSTAGAFTATKPVAPQHIVALGWVIKVNASSGEIFVNINNGWELDELHNVLITSAASGNTLIYDATAGVWKNANLTAGTGISVTGGAGSISITNTAPDQTVSLTGAGATSISGTYPNFTITSVNTTYSPATSTVAGLIELASDTVQSTAANAVTSTASRTYGLQVNAAGQGVVNVPWTDSGGTVTSVTGTSPVASSGGTTPAISLSSGYGDTQNPYASKTANFFLAAPNGVAGAPTFRAIVAADIPTLNQNTTGTASNVTGTVAVGNGGTGSTTLTLNNVLLGNGTSALQVVAPGTSGNVLTSNGTTWISQALSALTTANFTGTNQTLANAGYQKLPGGLIINWNRGATSQTAQTFPIAFPTACLAIAGTVISSIDRVFGCTSLTRTGFTSWCGNTGGGSTTDTWDYIAVGY